MNWYKYASQYNSGTYAGWLSPTGETWSGSSHDSFFATTGTRLQTTYHALYEGWVRITNPYFNRIRKNYELGFELPLKITSQQMFFMIKMIQDTGRLSKSNINATGDVEVVMDIARRTGGKLLNIRDAIAYLQSYPKAEIEENSNLANNMISV